MAMRGSPRPQETHLTVVGYDDAGDAGRKGGDGPSARAHGGLTGADDGEKGGKRRGIASTTCHIITWGLKDDSRLGSPQLPAMTSLRSGSPPRKS